MSAHPANPDRFPCVDTIAARLEGFEETIISKLIDRAQFLENNAVYQPGKSGFFDGDKRSLFHLRLYYQERMDAVFGRFCVPEERPFTTRLPAPQRALPPFNVGLHCNDIDAINLMPLLVDRYLALVPHLCKSGDDGNCGSSSEHDTYALQAIARRVHYGAAYVAESKFRNAPDSFLPLMRAGDEQAIIDKLTRKEVERRILDRIEKKVVRAQEKANPHVRHLVDPAVVVDFYRDTIIPLTKKGEALYLIHRRPGA